MLRNELTGLLSGLHQPKETQNIPGNIICTLESLSPFAHGKSGEGAHMWDPNIFRVTTITDCRMPRGHAISVLSLAVWWAKLEKNDKERHNMTQIASSLVLATVLIVCNVCILQSEGGGEGRLICKIKLPMQKLELKMQGGLCARGGA